MDPITAQDDITVIITSIEMHRQEMEKESGPAAACNEALRKLHELLDQERKALKLHESGVSLQSAARTFSRNKGRRTMGRGER